MRKKNNIALIYPEMWNVKCEMWENAQSLYSRIDAVKMLKTSQLKVILGPGQL
jgi:hypothetical protein